MQRMPKILCISGMVIAALVGLLFLVNLIIPLVLNNAWAPFKGASMMLDIVFVLCAAGLGYISWQTYKEQP